MIIINYKNKMASGQYTRTHAIGDLSDYPVFKPQFAPAEMLAMGVFEGLYLNSCQDEYPSAWFENARISDVADPQLNYFRVKSRTSLSHWRAKGWITPHDTRGWFEWYCRFWMGRRTDIDAQQIYRWVNGGNRGAHRQVVKNGGGDRTKRLAQRQTLLQWSRDPFPDIDAERAGGPSAGTALAPHLKRYAAG
jgi:hypothetical protein